MTGPQTTDHIMRSQHLDAFERQQVRAIDHPGRVGWTTARTTCGGYTTGYTVEFPGGERVLVPAARLTVVSDISIPPWPSKTPGADNVIRPERWRAVRVHVVGDAP